MVPDGHGGVREDEVREVHAESGELVLAVEAFSVNRGEVYQLDSPRPGWRPGKDVAGTVMAAAPDGAGPPVGARVVVHVPHSGWAERVAAPVSAVAELPADVGTRTAAALPLAGLTALRLLRHVGSLIGRRILITGASGGVGHYLVELAVAGGAEVTAVTRTFARGTRLRELGARTVTTVQDADGWFDVALESVGGPTLTAARRKVHPEGEVVWFGQAGGRPISIDFFDWIADTAGAPITQFHYAGAPARDGEDLRTLVRLVSQRRLHPEIGVQLPWQHTGKVVRDLRERRVRGNAVLTVVAPNDPNAGRTGRGDRNDIAPGTRQVLDRYLHALTTGDLDAVAASFAADATWWLHGDLPLSGTKRGRSEIVNFLIDAGSLFEPGTQAFEFGPVTVEEHRAVLEWQVTGTGAATGRAYDNSYCGVFIVRDGVISEVREYLDSQHAGQTLFRRGACRQQRPKNGHQPRPVGSEIAIGGMT